VVERTRVSQVTPETPCIPRAMVYGLSRALPGDRLVDTVTGEVASANLTPAPRRQDHTTSPSASPRSRLQRRSRPPPPVPTFVTMANAPLQDGMIPFYCCFYPRIYDAVCLTQTGRHLSDRFLGRFVRGISGVLSCGHIEEVRAGSPC